MHSPFLAVPSPGEAHVKLLHVIASPRLAGSTTLGISDHFLRSAAEEIPALAIETLDLFQADLPAIAGDNIEAKYTLLSGLPIGRGARRVVGADRARDRALPRGRRLRHHGADVELRRPVRAQVLHRLHRAAWLPLPLRRAGHPRSRCCEGKRMIVVVVVGKRLLRGEPDSAIRLLRAVPADDLRLRRHLRHDLHPRARGRRVTRRA